MAEKSDEPLEKVTLTIKGVDPAWRAAFNGVCESYHQDRGEVITALMREYVGKTCGYDEEGLTLTYNDEVQAIKNRKARNAARKAKAEVKAITDDTQPDTMSSSGIDCE